MKVTGWTYFENSNYIDVSYLRMQEIGRISKLAPSLPTREDCHTKSAEEIEIMSKAHFDFMDNAFKSGIIKEYDELLIEMEDAVVKDIREHNYHFTGDMHQNSDFGTPIIDDKYIFCVSQRSWGSIIVEAYPKEFDEDDKYNYVDWAWIVPEGEKVILPDKSLWVD